MRIDTVELHPAGSAFVGVLSFKDPGRANPYNVKTMTGLDPDVIVPRYYGKALNSNDSFYNLAPLKRSFAMKIGLNPQFSAGKSYSDLRDDLYRMVASSRTGSVQVQFKYNGAVVAAVTAKVSKMEAPQFEKAPEVTVTFDSDDSLLKALNPVNVNVAGLNLANVNIQDLLSTAPHGFDFVVTYLVAAASINLSDPTNPARSFIVSPVGGFLVGDVLHFSSDPKDKKLYIVRGAATIYLADVITPGSMWPILFPGDNHFNAVAPGSMQINSISYYPTYWGV